MVVLLTDFGWQGPYIGQMKLAVASYAPQCPVIDLMHDLPRFNVQAAAYLLSAYTARLPQGSIVVAVVDPGVGSSMREPVIVEADGCWFVGPGNGLFDRVCATAERYRYWRITWQPSSLSSTFHGRDIFAPVAAMLASGTSPEQLGESAEWQSQGCEEQLAEVIYIDHYGNCVTGIDAEKNPTLEQLSVNDGVVRRVQTFSDVPPGQPLLYENSSGLLEIAVNQGRADQLLSLSIGSPLMLSDDC